MRSSLPFIGIMLFGTMLLAVGCSKTRPALSPTPDEVLNRSIPGRFQFSSSSTEVALDTKTGLLCRTFGSDDSELPLCIDLTMNEYVTVNQIRAANYAEREVKERGMVINPKTGLAEWPKSTGQKMKP